MNALVGNTSHNGLGVLCDAESAAPLLRLATLGEELGSAQVAHQARELAARVSEGLFYVACVGQFKRGKSTLINALIGQPLLPVGFVPVTAVPTVVRFGEPQRARVRDDGGVWTEIALSDLWTFVSEERNPENTKRIMGVEVFVPAPLLSTGMCLVDTPGLGSVFTGNSAATRALVPHIDAALVVLGADPPLAGEELALVEAVARQVRDVILVLNKADRASQEERAAAVRFSREILEKRLHQSMWPIFEVSAAEQSEKRWPGREWTKLVGALQRLVEDSGRQLIRAACQRGITRLGEQLLGVIRVERLALQRPLQESERQISAMKETLAGAERSMRELSFLWMAEQRHLSDAFVGRHKAFLTSVVARARREFDGAIPSHRQWSGPSYRRALMNEAQEIARRQVLPWLRTEQEDAEKAYRQVAARFIQMGNDFLHKLADVGIPELARLPHALDPETGFRYRSEFTFRELIEIAQPASPLRWLADLFLGVLGARGRIENAAREFLDHLLEVNCTRVQSDILNRVQESRGRLEGEIRRLLHEVSRVAEQALSHARAKQAEGASAVHAALARLDNLEREVYNLRPQR